MALAVPLSLVVTSSASAEPADVQFQCDATTKNDWLAAPSNLDEGEKIDSALVRPISKYIERAIALLDDQSAIALTRDQLIEFTGAQTSEAIPPSDPYRAYLVRAVFPTRRPLLDVRWSGNDLHVFASGLGCAPFAKHPVIVFLTHEPERVFVTASAAL
jgi:hypothetical protein